MNSETKTCQNCKQNFTIELEDFNFYEKIKVPAPTFCPECRLQRRMAFRNERTLYKRKCDLCEKNIITIYSPDKPFPVYCRECWYSDKWDPFGYGVNYDWDKPFFRQFRELVEKVPRIALVHYHTNIDVDYSNYTVDSKNVYLSYSTVLCENVYYSSGTDKSKDIFDCTAVNNTEIAYENIESARNSRTIYVFRSRNCLDPAFLFDCVNCQNCFMSSNLRNKNFVIRNRQYNKEGYESELKKINTGSYQQLDNFKKEFEKLIKKSLHKFANALD